MNIDPELEQEALRPNNLSYGGLMAIGVVFLQPFVAGTPLSTAAKVCVVSFSIAIPLLAALLLVNYQEVFRRRATRSRVISVTRSLAQALAFTGVVAGLWHVMWVAGVATLVTGLVALGVHSAGYTKVEWPAGYPTDNKSGDS